MNIQRTNQVLLFAATLIFSSVAFGDVKLDIKAEKDIVTVNDKGEEQVQRVIAEKVVPGEQVIYTLTATNTGDETVENVVILDPVPEHTIFVDGSLSGGPANVVFSVDGGKSYNEKDQLIVVGENGEERAATAEDFTHIKWTLTTPLDSGQTAAVSFRSQLK